MHVVGRFCPKPARNKNPADFCVTTVKSSIDLEQKCLRWCPCKSRSVWSSSVSTPDKSLQSAINFDLITYSFKLFYVGSLQIQVKTAPDFQNMTVLIALNSTVYFIHGFDSQDDNHCKQFFCSWKNTAENSLLKKSWRDAWRKTWNLKSWSSTFVVVYSMYIPSRLSDLLIDAQVQTLLILRLSMVRECGARKPADGDLSIIIRIPVNGGAGG